MTRLARPWCFGVLCVLAFSAGCAHRQPDNVWEASAVTALQPGYTVIGHSVHGRPIACYDLGDGEELIVFIAGIHGSEPAGVPLSQRLLTELNKSPELLDGRRVVIVANANPDGLADQKRFNPNGIDLNRNFPAKNHSTQRDRHGKTPLSEPESQALHDLFQRLPRPARVITLHQPLSCIDYDGPEDTTLPLAEALAEASGLPVKKLGSRPGSLGSWLGVDQQVPTITVEFHKSDTDLPTAVLWDTYGPMMLESVTYTP